MRNVPFQWEEMECSLKYRNGYCSHLKVDKNMLILVCINFYNPWHSVFPWCFFNSIINREIYHTFFIDSFIIPDYPHIYSLQPLLQMYLSWKNRTCIEWKLSKALFQHDSFPLFSWHATYNKKLEKPSMIEKLSVPELLLQQHLTKGYPTSRRMQWRCNKKHSDSPSLNHWELNNLLESKGIKLSWRSTTELL